MSAALAGMLGLSIGFVMALFLSVTHADRRLDAADAELAAQQARLTAALAALRECLAANEQLQNAVREREQAIGALLRRLNAANVRAAGGERLVATSFILGLPLNQVNPSWFNRN